MRDRASYVPLFPVRRFAAFPPIRTRTDVSPVTGTTSVRRWRLSGMRPIPVAFGSSLHEEKVPAARTSVTATRANRERRLETRWMLIMLDHTFDKLYCIIQILCNIINFDPFGDGAGELRRAVAGADEN